MNMLIRPFNADPPILYSALGNRLQVGGIVIDAHIVKLAQKAMSNLRQALPSAMTVLIDPVTHKIRKPFFRGKARSYGRLDYFFTSEFGDRSPTMRELGERTRQVAQGVLEVQQTLGATSLLTPYMYVEADSFPTSTSPTAFSVNEQWMSEFGSQAAQASVTLSLCVSADCLTDPDALAEIEQFIEKRKPSTIYLLLFDFELGQNPLLDQAVITFLAKLRGAGAKRIIYSHAPPWIYFLYPYGITDFVTGINYLSTLKREYLDRAEGIGGISHNYYLPRRFCRMTTEQALDAINVGILDPCECPVCRGGVPDTQNAIREHYLHARAQECAELRNAADARELLHEWAEETEEFLVEVDGEGLRIVGDEPLATQWRALVQ